MKAVNLAAQLATAETELACVRMVLAHVKVDRDELRQERDEWRREAEMLCAEKLIAAKLREADERRPAPLDRRPWWRRLAAELEAEEGDFESALARIDEALALAREAGVHMNDAFVYRLRGEILLKRGPANPALAEEAFRAALAIAQQQGGRFYGLRAALSLAKLYQSTARPAEAHAVLAPALEGFSPTKEMPEIAEAQALLETLASQSGRSPA
jgi:tetratricopeptide (TPR) repeat protein